jgi:hypothetical protein
MLSPYTTIEEAYCISAGKNVAVETTHLLDGSCQKNCLNLSCQLKHPSSPCTNSKEKQ